MPKSKQVYEILKKQGSITDRQLAKIWGGEPNFDTAVNYIQQAKRLLADQNFFADKKITEKKKQHRSHFVRAENQWYRVGKQFFDEIELST